MANITKTCTQCGKKFLITDQEQKLLENKKLPPPEECPTDRQLRRLKLRGERTLYKTKCQKCGKDIVVSYEPTKVHQTILCKEDYEKYFAENDGIITDPPPEA